MVREGKGSGAGTGTATTVRTIPPAAHLPRWPAALIAVALLALAALVVYLVATRATESSLSVPVVQRGAPSATAGTQGTPGVPAGTATVPATATSGTPGAIATPSTTPSSSPATQLTPYQSTAGDYTAGYPAGWSAMPQTTPLGEQGARFAPPASGPAGTSVGIYRLSTGVLSLQQILDEAPTLIGVPAFDLTPVTSPQSVLLDGVACQRQVFHIPAGLSGYPVDTDVLFVGCSGLGRSWDMKFFAPAAQFAAADAAYFEPMLQGVHFGG